MLKKLENLPKGVLGISAEGTVTKEDYESVLIPLLKEAHDKGEKVRFLYQMGPNFSTFTLAAAVDDFRVGVKYLSLFEKCAIVTDVEWIKAMTKLFGLFMPCPVKEFRGNQVKEAGEWLSSQ